MSFLATLPLFVGLASRPSQPLQPPDQLAIEKRTLTGATLKIIIIGVILFVMIVALFDLAQTVITQYYTFLALVNSHPPDDNIIRQTEQLNRANISARSVFALTTIIIGSLVIWIIFQTKYRVC